MMDFVKAAKESESGLDPAGLAEALKLLLSASQAMVELAEEIHSCDGRHPTWVLRSKVVEELEALKTYMLQTWGILLGAGDKALVQQARDATHGIEDLEDTIEYHRLQCPRGRHRRCSALVLWKLLIGCDRSSSSNPSKFIKDIKLVTRQTRKLVQKLANGAGPSSFHPLGSPDSGLGTRKSDVVPLKQPKVFGRDKERDEIVEMLIDPCGKPAPEIISIVGAGGVGKTTLAQMVFNDARVGQHFDVTSWVFVSSSSNKMELTAEILRSAQPAWDGSAENTVDFQVLQSRLRQFLASKRYLIVLDDVSNSKDEIWQDILTPLRSADAGSRILLTSRMNMLGASQLYSLNPLDSGDCWAVLKEHASCGDSNGVHEDLQLIPKEMTAKNHGSPLAAKLVGGVLAATRSRVHWKNIVEAGLQGNAAALPLSYSYLPGHLKRCFAYCSLFPRNWKFDPAHLIRLWIAEGLIQPQNKAGRRMEDTARVYFDQLLSHSFFHELKLGSKTYYLVHSLLHDLAESVAAEDCFRIEEGTNCDIPSTVRHLSVAMNNLHSLTSFCELGKLRTLLIQRPLSFSSDCCNEDFVVQLRDLLGKSKNLRVLDLSGFNLKELPQPICDLFHLRYLCIHGSIKKLPESIGKLLHLQTLYFTEKCYLDKLPAGINMLVNLRHLGVETQYTAGLVGIGRLANLQGSLELHVEKWEGRTLEELRNINGLHGLLKIKGLENVSSKEEACKAELHKKCHLNSLNLEWSSASRNLQSPTDAVVLEGLQPHQDIIELHIRRYRGTRSPSWLQLPSLQQLQSLHLINFRSLGILPPLGQLQSLRYLHMKEICAVDRVGHEFYGTGDVAFPSLSVLEFDDFPRLHEWSGLAYRKSFPCLERLIIRDCPELVKIPPFLPTTREVTIERTRLIPYMRLAPSSSEMLQLDVCTTSVLVNGLLHKQHTKSIVALNVSGAEQLVAAEELGSLVSLKRLQLCQCDFTDQTFSRFLQALPCLSSLELIDLPNITSLPVSDTLQFSTMLTELSIRNCQLLGSPSSLPFFDSLKYLVIERCPEVTAASFPENFASLSSLKVLRISYCSKLQSLPVCAVPSSLETLHIIGCHPELSRQLRDREGHYFEKLAVVPKVLIQ